MSARRRALAVAIVGLFAVPMGCARSEESAQWSDASEVGWSPVLDPTTAVEGDGWRFDVGLESWDTGEPRRPCLQLVAAEQPLGCVEIDPGPDRHPGFAANVRVGDERIIWRASTVQEDRPLDHFVVWSSASPDGRRVEAITYRSVVNLLWIMEPGEAPWGYQTIAPDGALVHHTTLVGLPGE